HRPGLTRSARGKEREVTEKFSVSFPLSFVPFVLTQGTHPVLNPQSLGHALKPRRQSLPSQFIDRIKKTNVAAQRGERPEEQGPLTFERQGRCQRSGIRNFYFPHTSIFGNGFEMQIPGKHGAGGLRAPSLQTGKAVGGVSHQRQVVRNGLWQHPKLRDYATLVLQAARPPVHLHYSRSLHALSQIFIGRTYNHPLHSFILGRGGGR